MPLPKTLARIYWKEENHTKNTKEEKSTKKREERFCYPLSYCEVHAKITDWTSPGLSDSVLSRDVRC
jgi:hypothetical protein